MARLASIANGNFTDAATWGLVDPTSALVSDNAGQNVTNVFTGMRSQAFTPGAITITHIALRHSARLGSTGNFQVHLADSATFTEVPGTLVTVNVSDFQFPSTTSNGVNGGWMFFKFASPVTLLAATGYVVECKTSSTNQIQLRRGNATAGNMARMLITSTTQAPAAGDELFIASEFTGGGTYNAITVTMENTANTDFGTGSTSYLTPSLSVSYRATLDWATTASTDFLLRLSGILVVNYGATMTMGTSSVPCPDTSTMTLLFDSSAAGDFGLVNFGTVRTYGSPRTAGKLVTQCLLNTDEAVASTSLGVDTDTGWLDNDRIAIASTTQLAVQCENGTLNGNAGASSLTVDGFGGAGGGLQYAHLGTAPIQAEVILLTRNVIIKGNNTSSTGFVSNLASGYNVVFDFNWTEFIYLGANATFKYGGIFFDRGTCSIRYCSINNTNATNIVSGLHVLPSTNYCVLTVEDTVFYRIYGEHVYVVGYYSGGVTSTITFARCTFILNQTNTMFYVTPGIGSSLTDIRVAGAGGISGSSQIPYGVFTYWYGDVPTHDFTIHSCAGSGIKLYAIGANNFSSDTDVYNFNIYRCVDAGIEMFHGMFGDKVIFRDSNIFGCDIGIKQYPVTTGGIAFSQYGGAFIYPTIQNVSFNGDTTYPMSAAISLYSLSVFAAKFVNCDFGSVSGIKTSPGHIFYFWGSQWCDAVFTDCLFTYLTSLYAINPLSTSIDPIMMADPGVAFENFNQVNGDHRMLKIGGWMYPETTTVRTGGKSIKLEPKFAYSFRKLTTSSFIRPVTAGATLTPSVYVYEDASYNGNRARLILKRNDALGVASDTVLAIATAASDGAWEQLTGVTPVATIDGCFEFTIDCDGTAGALFVDDFTV